jgi:hypothetical protein
MAKIVYRCGSFTDCLDLEAPENSEAPQCKRWNPFRDKVDMVWLARLCAFVINFNGEHPDELSISLDETELSRNICDYANGAFSALYEILAARSHLSYIRVSFRGENYVITARAPRITRKTAEDNDSFFKRIRSEDKRLLLEFPDDPDLILVMSYITSEHIPIDEMIGMECAVEVIPLPQEDFDYGPIYADTILKINRFSDSDFYGRWVIVPEGEYIEAVDFNSCFFIPGKRFAGLKIHFPKSLLNDAQFFENLTLMKVNRKICTAVKVTIGETWSTHPLSDEKIQDAFFVGFCDKTEEKKYFSKEISLPEIP